MTQENRNDVSAPESFRKLIQSQMEQRGIKLKDLSEKTGLSDSYLSRLISGLRGLPPDEKTILKIAEALQIDPPSILLVEAGRLSESIKNEVVHLPPVFFREAGTLTQKERAEMSQAIQSILSRREKKKKK